MITVSESVRSRMLKESDFISAIENYMFEDHSMIRRAAMQCFTNLCTSPFQVKRCEGKNDKVSLTKPKSNNILETSKISNPLNDLHRYCHFRIL